MTEATVQQFVTEDVVADVIGQIAGGVIDVGPIAAGPGGIAKATAHGVLRRAEVELHEGWPVRFTARVPVAVELSVRTAAGDHRYSIDASVAIRATVGYAEGCAVVEPEPLSSKDIVSTVRAHGLKAKLLQKTANVDGELRREVATYVNGRLDGADVASIRRIPLPA